MCQDQKPPAQKWILLPGAEHIGGAICSGFPDWGDPPAELQWEPFAATPPGGAQRHLHIGSGREVRAGSRGEQCRRRGCYRRPREDEDDEEDEDEDEEDEDEAAAGAGLRGEA